MAAAEGAAALQALASIAEIATLAGVACGIALALTAWILRERTSGRRARRVLAVVTSPTKSSGKPVRSPADRFIESGYQEHQQTLTDEVTPSTELGGTTADESRHLQAEKLIAGLNSLGYMVSIATSDADVISEAERVEDKQATQTAQSDHTTHVDDPYEQRKTTTPLSHAAELIREFNASNQADEDLWTRTRQADDAVRRSGAEAQATHLAARRARDLYLAVQAEWPHRRASLPRQLSIATVTVALLGVACWFAAQALGIGQVETRLCAGLFLAILTGGEIALDYCRDRYAKAWRLLVVSLTAFVVGLGVLSFLFLTTSRTQGLVTAAAGAFLFVILTASLLMIAYWVLRSAETPQAWVERRRARRAERNAAAASAKLARCLARRDRLVDAYLARMRGALLQRYSASELPVMESALRAHLGDPSERRRW